MKIVFNIKEDDARNPGVIADCTGDNAGDSVGPTADGFETYGVTGVALISFILLAVPEEDHPGATACLDLRDAHHDDRRERPFVLDQPGNCEGALLNAVRPMNFEAPLDQSLVWITSFDLGRYDLSVLSYSDLGSWRRHDLVEAFDRDHLRDARRRDHPGTGQSIHFHRIRDMCARS